MKTKIANLKEKTIYLLRFTGEDDPMDILFILYKSRIYLRYFILNEYNLSKFYLEYYIDIEHSMNLLKIFYILFHFNLDDRKALYKKKYIYIYNSDPFEKSYGEISKDLKNYDFVTIPIKSNLKYYKQIGKYIKDV